MGRIQEFIRYLEAEKTKCAAESSALTRDDRKDEADLAKIRANIFGVVASVCGAAEKQSAKDPIEFIKDKIETIPQAWAESLAAAEKHGDHLKAAIERIKLNAMAEISIKLTKILEK